MRHNSKHIKRFTRNTVGKDYICGDIHGEYSKLHSILDLIRFDETKDRLFSVGDLGDRGPESHRSIEFLNKPWFHAVRGNHEQMFLDYHGESYYGIQENFIQNGGSWAVGMTKEERLPYFDAYSDLPIVIELETEYGMIGIVHADVPYNEWGLFVKQLDGPNAEQIIDHVIWKRTRYKNSNKNIIKGIDLVVVGHTVVKTPTRLGNVIYIDTGCVFERTTQQGHNGHGLTIFDVQSKSTEIFNSNLEGK